MTLEQLRIFVAVAERQNMTRAAEGLGLTQSAVSAAVGALESQYGLLLFNRVGRGLELSASGALFLTEARAVLGRAQAAKAALEDMAGLKRGFVCIAASQTVASYWLPGRLARFATLYPGISVRLIVANTAQASQMVMDGLVDFSVVEGKVLDPKLLRTDIGSDRLSIYASPQHELGAAQRASVQDLKDAQWIMREAGSGTKSELELALGVHGINMDDLVVLMELPSNEAVLGAVSSGGVIAAVSDLAAAPHVAAGNLVPVGFSLTMRRFTLLSHSERLLSHAARALAETFAP